MKRILLALVGLIGFSSLADAADKKVISGSFCRAVTNFLSQSSPSWTAPAPGTQLENPPPIGFGGGGLWIDQSAANFNSAICPLWRDSTGNTNGLSSVFLHVRDFNTTTSITCAVIASSPDATQTFQSQVVETGVAYVTPPGGMTTLTFTSTMLPQSWSQGYYVLMCTMYPKDELYNIVYTEYSAGDPT